MTKITEESIKEHLISKGWVKQEIDIFGTIVIQYISNCVRYKLSYSILSNLAPDDEFGWQLHIDDSNMRSIARGDVEYIEQIFALIDIYKNY
jgi:hypothetical protein